MGLLWLLSRPLASKSKSTRDLMGWFALVTLFNASCLWIYVLFFRSNKPPAPGPPVARATASHGGDGHSDSAKPDPGAKSGDHGAKPPKAKKAAKKSSAKSQSAAHGGGH